jgi:outer membrane protein TolC
MKTQLAFVGVLLAWSVSLCAAEPWTFERALQQALATNPSARIAGLRIAAAHARLEQANAAFWPRLQFQSSYIRTDNPMTVFGAVLNQRTYSSSLDFNHVPDVDNLNTRGLITLPLYTGGRNGAGHEAAKAGDEAARQDSQASQNELGFEVARAFFTVLKTRQFIQATEAAVRSFEQNLAIAKKRLAAGTLLKADELGFEVHLAQAREDLIRARNASDLAARALHNLLAIEGEEFTVADTAPVVRAPDSADFSGRADLAAASQRERAAEQRVREAKGSFYPQVSAFASLDNDRGWRRDGSGNSYSAGGLLQWDLWDGELTRAKVREASANLSIAREELRKLRLALDLEVESARLDLKAANERITVTDQSVTQASESAVLTQERFEKGMALSTQLIDAETALISARVRRAEAETDQRIAIAALRKALGWPQLDTPRKATGQ